MNDYQKYINALRKCAKEHDNDKTSMGHIIVSDLCRDTANLLEELEQEPKTGHWIEQIDHEENCRTLICSNCDRPALHDEDSIWKHKFCPHCGCAMVEPQEGADE